MKVLAIVTAIAMLVVGASAGPHIPIGTGTQSVAQPTATSVNAEPAVATLCMSASSTVYARLTHTNTLVLAKETADQWLQYGKSCLPSYISGSVPCCSGLTCVPLIIGVGGWCW